MTDTLKDLIAAHFDPDADVTAQAVFKAAKVPKKWRDLFYLVVHDECRRSARLLVRSHERGLYFDTPDPTTQDTATIPHTPGLVCHIDDVSVFLADSMFCGLKYGHVNKGSATAPQWDARADYLDCQIAGTMRTRDECVTVAEFLRDAGVACLADVQVAA